MAQIYICPQCGRLLFSLMDKKSGKTIEEWDHKKMKKVKIKYKKYKYECARCGYKFKDDEVHY